jgi:hypothetical protein
LQFQHKVLCDGFLDVDQLSNKLTTAGLLMPVGLAAGGSPFACSALRMRSSALVSSFPASLSWRLVISKNSLLRSALRLLLERSWHSTARSRFAYWHAFGRTADVYIARSMIVDLPELSAPTRWTAWRIRTYYPILHSDLYLDKLRQDWLARIPQRTLSQLIASSPVPGE